MKKVPMLLKPFQSRKKPAGQKPMVPAVPRAPKAPRRKIAPPKV